MFINRKEPDIGYAKVGKQYVPIERLSPRRTHLDKYFAVYAVVGTVVLAVWMILSAGN